MKNAKKISDKYVLHHTTAISRHVDAVSALSSYWAWSLGLRLSGPWKGPAKHLSAAQPRYDSCHTGLMTVHPQLVTARHLTAWLGSRKSGTQQANRNHRFTDRKDRPVLD